MKWLRIILPIFLIMGMLLCINSVAYADPGDEPPPEDNPGDGGNPDDGSGLNVNVTVVGDNSEVGVDLYGDDNTADVNFHSENPTVYINGQNLNQPTVIYQGGGGGVDGSWVKKKIGQAVDPLYSWADEAQARIGLTVDGLAKVILVAQSNESELDAQISLSEEYGNRLTNLESDTAYLGARADALKAQDEAIKTYIVAVEDYLRADYNRKLVTWIGVFSLVVIGLAVGLVLLWRRIRVLS